MQFQPGHKLAPGGPRPNSGRPSTRELKEIAKAANKARLKLEKCVEDIESRYVRLALDGKHERSTIHAMENYVRPVTHDIQPTAIIHQFIQFAPGNQNPVQLSAEGVSTPILVGDGRGEETSSSGLAQAERQGQDGLEFHSFTHVRGK